jgi:hypothetical protein
MRELLVLLLLLLLRHCSQSVRGLSILLLAVAAAAVRCRRWFDASFKVFRRCKYMYEILGVLEFSSAPLEFG